MKIILLLLLLCFSFRSMSQTYATTDDGRRVVLNDDSTWRFTVGVETSQEDTSSKRILTRPAASKTLKQSERNKYALWYNDKKWKQTDKNVTPVAEFSFLNTGQFPEAYSMVITERVEVSFSNLKSQIIANSKKNAENFKIVKQEYLTVNNHKVLHLVFGANVQSMEFEYDGYYATGASGIVQVICFTTKNLFATYERDFDDLLNGLVEMQ